MSDQTYKVLITTSGAGARLGELATHTNPSLVRLLKKPILSHIVESYPREIEIVVTLGYFGNLVKEFLLLAYPERKFTFVEVDKYQGEGSSQGYSMLCAKEYLQCPFIFHAGDTVITESVSDPLQNNWCGGFKGGASEDYASFIELDEKVLSFNYKGVTDFDYLYVGLAGIKDYEKFWQVLSEVYNQDKNDSRLGDVQIMGKLIKEGLEFVPKEFKTWLDLGNLEALMQARKKMGDYLVNLDKPEEATFVFDEDFVIKFMADEKSVRERVERAKNLKGLVPEITGSSRNFYKYKYVSGRLYSRAVTPSDFAKFLDWAKTNLWKEAVEADEKEFQSACLDFYKNKTLKRIERFYELTGIKDDFTTINGEDIPPLEEVFKKIDFQWLSQGRQGGFHGDFILDNIIKNPDSYVLLDWRQNFGRFLKVGDQNYDLAKLNHNLTVNHDIVFNNLYSVKVRGKVVLCDIMRSENLVACQKVLWDFIEREAYDLKKIKFLTSLAWLNMAPLHHHPYNYFLYYFGKLNLWKNLQK